MATSGSRNTRVLLLGGLLIRGLSLLENTRLGCCLECSRWDNNAGVNCAIEVGFNCQRLRDLGSGLISLHELGLLGGHNGCGP